jgi:hypothetical protein
MLTITYQLQYEQRELFFASTMTICADYVHYVHQVIEEDHQLLVYNQHWMVHLVYDTKQSKSNEI